jgi:threonine/homoserine/homoserine lactone efflux protein
MAVLLPLVLGFLTASVGIIPPGLINMTAAKISVLESRRKAYIFAFGAVCVVIIQTYVAISFARYINRHPDVVLLMREVGLGIFLALTGFFLWRGRRETTQPDDKIAMHSSRSRFFYGALLSALNFFPIPFYVFISVTLASYQYFFFTPGFLWLFVAGSASGALFGFYCYITFFKRLEKKTAFILRNMNYIIASITGFVSLLTIWNVAEYYYA